MDLTVRATFLLAFILVCLTYNCIDAQQTTTPNTQQAVNPWMNYMRMYQNMYMQRLMMYRPWGMGMGMGWGGWGWGGDDGPWDD